MSGSTFEHTLPSVRDVISRVLCYSPVQVRSRLKWEEGWSYRRRVREASCRRF